MMNVTVKSKCVLTSAVWPQLLTAVHEVHSLLLCTEKTNGIRYHFIQ